MIKVLAIGNSFSQDAETFIHDIAKASGIDILFGGLYILNSYIPTGTNLAVKEIYKMLPYIFTIIVLVLSSLRNKRENQPPASLGLAYFREER